MKLSEAIALFDRCTGMEEGLLFDPACEGCPLALKMGDPEDKDAFGLAYTIQACSFLQELEQILKDTPLPSIEELHRGA